MTVTAALPVPTAAAPSSRDAGRDAQPRDEVLEGGCQEQLYEFLQRYFGEVRQRPGLLAERRGALSRQLSLTPLGVVVGPAARTGAAGCCGARR